MIILLAFSLAINILLIVLLNQQNQNKRILPKVNTIPSAVTKLKYSTFENVIASAAQNPPVMQNQAVADYEHHKLIRNLETQIIADNNRKFLHDVLNWLLDNSQDNRVLLDAEQYTDLSSALAQLQDMYLIEIVSNQTTLVILNCGKIKFYQQYCENMPLQQVQQIWQVPNAS